MKEMSAITMSRSIILFLAATALVGCKSEIDHAEITVRNGLIYKYGETTPFTGIILNAPSGTLAVNGLCNFQVEKGRHHGKGECFHGTQKVYEVEFISGKKDGKESTFNEETGKKEFVNHWKDNHLHGMAERYFNGVLVSQKEYKNGRADGKEIHWTKDRESVLTNLEWMHGNKSTGFETTSEGKFQYLNGQQYGPQIKYGTRLLEGKLIKYISSEENYSSGKKNETQKYFVSPYNSDAIIQESEIFYRDGVAISGWKREINIDSGEITQEIKLIQSPEYQDPNFHSQYPGNLVPDGSVKWSDHSSNGEDIWAYGKLVKGYTQEKAGTRYYIIDESSKFNKFQSVDKSTYDSTITHVVKNTSSAQNSDACLDAWIKDYRDELGDDAMIIAEQLNEWKELCSQGSRP